ncbi:poly(A) RNA polymerase, mitochondrial isoform X1 [Girardinichthys multiradiatus]|uniref:poly(A) RNA polymerase, mitochondrial isoform X1 n=2 Tax=Girardinichthys multiradiatus TaxID=208333 RepID=UPI001FAD72EE|nr:poly(A) RNA polymerase, mitochondrial isoform X1 [Girardinichthys multiradiatus]
MRFLSLFRTAMASSFTVHRLHMRGRSRLEKCRNTFETIFRRSVGTEPEVAQTQGARGDHSGDKDGPKSLYNLMADRQEQAEKSVLISCPSRTSEKRFLKFLSNHGDIKKHFFYESYGVYAVVEFASRDNVVSLLESAAIPGVSHESVVPFKSRLLSLRNHSSVDSPTQQSGLPCQPQTTVPISELIQRLSREESVDDQINSLTEAYQLTEENSRLRFLVCSLLKDIAASYFPECTIRPFGSSVNGFGKLGCDLDMFLDLDSISGWNMKMPKSGLSLEYQMKRTNSERHVTQSILSVIGECVDHFGPGCVGVQKILNARCPLVRFAHQPSGFQCDLTANNRVAMKSTELLYLYGELDPRVRSLVFTIRCWARAHGVTSSIPGAWITNFALTVMVLFFLQKRTPPIIPKLDYLRDLAGPADESVIEGNDCTFVTDFSKIQLPSNTETLEQLLSDFFEFYAMFPFSRMSINIRKGKEQNKLEVTPLHIQNPFETSLNVSKNVNSSQLDRFVALCQESAWLLQQSENRTPRGVGGDNTPTPWGLATLLLPSQVAGIKGRKKRKREPASERIKSLLESLKNKNEGWKSQDS